MKHFKDKDKNLVSDAQMKRESVEGHKEEDYMIRKMNQENYFSSSILKKS